MDEIKLTNYAMLRGVLSRAPVFSHESRGEKFFEFSLDVCRLSGVYDTVNIIARESVLSGVELSGAPKVCVIGELRSFNNKSGIGPKLIISVFARELYLEDGSDENIIELQGTICKQPNLRVTPMGREICDLMLAVNRRYGRSDYLPCIAWGSRARQASTWDIGTSAVLRGRIQSRKYTKLIDGESIEKTAYEVSIIDIAEAGAL